MTRRRLLLATVLAIVAAVASAVPGAAGERDQRDGWRTITGRYGVPPLPQDLSVENVRHIMQHHLEWEYGGRLKLGAVEEQDADTIVAEFVTPDGYLVQRLEVDRHTGLVRPAR